MKYSSFNGASADQRRKAFFRGMMPPENWCFNGASADQRRKDTTMRIFQQSDSSFNGGLR